MSDKYYRSTVLEVNLDHLEHNFNQFKSLHPDKMLIAVVKANAYGLGSTVVAQHLSKCGAEFFAVATLDEAIELRMHGIKNKILVMGVICPKDINKAIQHRIAVMAPNLEWVQKAKKEIKDKYDKEVWIHIKVNSGMNRLGTNDVNEIKQMIEEIHSNKYLVYEGIFTHLSSAESSRKVTDRQLDNFDNILTQVERPRFIHAFNSAGALNYRSDVTNAMRIGISLYGYYPGELNEKNTNVSLKPTIELKTKVMDVHQISKDDGVSYNLNYTADKDEYIAALPIGYADGLIRKYSNYKVRLETGEECPIVGTICMDTSMIVLPHHVPVGTKVTVIANDTSDQSLYHFSKYVDTITYESITSISRRIPRKYFKGQEEFVKNEVLK